MSCGTLSGFKKEQAVQDLSMQPAEAYRNCSCVCGGKNVWEWRIQRQVRCRRVRAITGTGTSVE